MSLIINGEVVEADYGTITAAVAAFAESPKGIAVALNGAVVARSTWDVTGLVDGDQVEILQAAQGG